MTLLTMCLIIAASALGGVFAGGIALAIGGLGGIRGLARQLVSVQDDVQKIDQRITHEIKSRVGKIGVETRTLKQELAELAAASPASATAKLVGRP